jgi:hypothetical protein
MILRITFFFLAFIALQAQAQQSYNYASIPENLTENANAVVRQERYDVVIASRRSMKTTFSRAVTILNEQGQRYIGAAVYYDKSTAIKAIEAIIYDKNGTQVKKIKRKEFLDHSVSSGTEITDGRTLSLDYTPIAYPFTVVFSYETETSNTAFIPQWSPVEGAFCSTEKEEINITADPSLGLKYKEYNFGDLPLNKQQQGTTLSFSAANIPAYRSEDYAPSLDRTKAKILFALEKFHLEGVDGDATSWEAFGSWIYNNLLQGTDELPEATVAKVRALVGNETDPLKKAKIVYKYMQSKTRYVSIQLGIGGWKPMPAKDVDRLGYGDCKALSNYTRALLKAVDVPAYYTIIYAGNGHRSLTGDFVSMQGNHAILAIPHNNQLVWLECTSQSMPFGFQGDFTDNRMALLVKPDKGELVRTHVYDTKGNTQLTTASYNILPDGTLNGSLKRVSSGLQYDDKFGWAALAPDELSKMYKESTFSNINNLKLKKTTLTNNDDVQQFTEDIAIEAAGYCNNSGGRMMFAINAFNQNSNIPQRYRTRRLPLDINTGFYDQDEVTINLPEGFTMEAMPQNVTLTDKFGEYKAEFSQLSPTQLLYKRSLTINNGEYAKEDYDKYREFREKIARNDNAKVVLIKK